jgi:hypothetical protein
MKYNKRASSHQHTKAFSMMEMILVLGIITLLVGSGVAGMMNVLDLGKETKAKADINTMLNSCSYRRPAKVSAPSFRSRRRNRRRRTGSHSSRKKS